MRKVRFKRGSELSRCCLFSPRESSSLYHDYKKNGTTTLFAALNIATGEVIGKCHPRHQEFLKFLKQLDKEILGKELHLTLDNYGTHKHKKAQKWLKRHKWFHLHFTPTSAS